MKKIFTTLALTLLVVFLFKCENDNMNHPAEKDVHILFNTITKFEAEYELGDELLNFKSELENGVVKSYFTVSEKGVQKILIRSLVDTNTPSYKLVVHEGVANEAKSLKDQMSSASISLDLVVVFEDFTKQILSNELIDHSSDLIQSLFVHNAIINTAKRSDNEKSDCNCTPHPGYFVDKTPFWCQEDYVIDTERFVRVIIESGYQLNQKEKELFDYLNVVSKNKRFVTIDKLLEITEDRTEYMSRVETQFLKANNKSIGISAKEDCTKGSDLGCCGNYSGCCWYWSIYCLEHDLECLGCDKWHCGPACTPHPK